MSPEPSPQSSEPSDCRWQISTLNEGINLTVTFFDMSQTNIRFYVYEHDGPPPDWPLVYTSTDYGSDYGSGTAGTVTPTWTISDIEVNSVLRTEGKFLFIGMLTNAVFDETTVGANGFAVSYTSPGDV